MVAVQPCTEWIPIKRKKIAMPETTWIVWKIKFLWSYQCKRFINQIRALESLKKAFKYTSKDSLLTIYKTFIKPHVDYCDIIYDQPGNKSFCAKIECIWYNAALTITGAIKGTSQTKLYKELGYEFSRLRRWYRRHFSFFKNKTIVKPEYLLDLIPIGQYFTILEV